MTRWRSTQSCGHSSSRDARSSHGMARGRHMPTCSPYDSRRAPRNLTSSSPLTRIVRSSLGSRCSRALRPQRTPNHAPITPQSHPDHTPITPQSLPNHSPITPQLLPNHPPPKKVLSSASWAAACPLERVTTQLTQHSLNLTQRTVLQSMVEDSPAHQGHRSRGWSEPPSPISREMSAEQKKSSVDWMLEMLPDFLKNV